MTLYRASNDLIHFMITVFTIFLCYAISGMFLFGRRLFEFSTLGRAVQTCFLIVMGDFDWNSLRLEHEITAGIWFWTFMILVFLIMLNMLLAIVMDIYTEVKTSSGSSEPVWEQAAT